MARIDIRDITEEQIVRLDKQVALLGLKSRSEYIRLIIELDSATGLIKSLRGDKQGKVLKKETIHQDFIDKHEKSRNRSVNIVVAQEDKP